MTALDSYASSPVTLTVHMPYARRLGSSSLGSDARQLASARWGD